MQGGMVGDWYIIDLVVTIAMEDGVPKGSIINIKVERNTPSQWVPEVLNPSGGYNSISKVERACHFFRSDEEVWLP